MSQATSISSQLSLWVKNCSRSELKRARSAGAEHLAKARPRLTKNDDLDPSTTLIGKKAAGKSSPRQASSAKLQRFDVSGVSFVPQ